MTYKHSFFTFRETRDLCCCLILDWTNTWLRYAKFKTQRTNIFSGVNYTSKKTLYIKLKKKKKIQVRGSIEPLSIK